MVFKCPVVRCIANYDCYDRGAVFSLLEKEEQKKQWISFQIERIFHPKRKSIFATDTLQTIFRKGLKRTKLLYEYKPVPTIIPVTREKENLPPNAIF